MENNSKDLTPGYTNSAPNGNKTDKSKNQKPTHSTDIRRNPMTKATKPSEPNISPSYDRKSDGEDFNPKHQTPGYLQDHKYNKDQITNNESDPPTVPAPAKQDNTKNTAKNTADQRSTQKGDSAEYDKKTQNTKVDGSVIVEEEDEANVISDNVEAAVNGESVPR